MTRDTTMAVGAAIDSLCDELIEVGAPVDTSLLARLGHAGLTVGSFLDDRNAVDAVLVWGDSDRGVWLVDDEDGGATVTAAVFNEATEDHDTAEGSELDCSTGYALVLAIEIGEWPSDYNPIDAMHEWYRTGQAPDPALR